MPVKRINQAEELFAKQLDFAGYSYEREYKANSDRRWRYDFLIHRKNLIVEIEGVTFGRQGGRHQSAVGFTKDCEKYNWIICNNYSLLRFTPNMVKGIAKSGKTISIEPAIDTVDRFLLGFDFKYTNREMAGYGK